MIVAPIIHHPREAVAVELLRRLIREREGRWRPMFAKAGRRQRRDTSDWLTAHATIQTVFPAQSHRRNIG
jgi:hypothetical protein